MSYLLSPVGAAPAAEFATVINGIAYTPRPNVPFNIVDPLVAAQLVNGAGWTTLTSGATGSRPGSPTAGQFYFDTTLSLLIQNYDTGDGSGVMWRIPTPAGVVSTHVAGAVV
jgi:hypothetical protein